ncbi:MAG: type II secretion system protein GspG [Planctomycetes bacterium]|nr:type II secretion system protein GspG [Planctomycetota bacterium]
MLALLLTATAFFSAPAFPAWQASAAEPPAPPASAARPATPEPVLRIVAPNLKAMLEHVREAPLGKILYEEEFQQFLAKPLEDLRGRVQKISPTLWSSMERSLPTISQCEISVRPAAEGSSDWLVLMRVDGASLASEWLAFYSGPEGSKLASIEKKGEVSFVRPKTSDPWLLAATAGSIFVATSLAGGAEPLERALIALTGSPAATSAGGDDLLIQVRPALLGGARGTAANRASFRRNPLSAVSSFGFDSLDLVTMTAVLGKSGAVSKIEVSKPGSDAPLGRLLSSLRPVKSDLVRFLPDGIDAASALSIDWAALFPPPPADEPAPPSTTFRPINDLLKDTPVVFPRDLSSIFGKEVAIYSLPPRAGASIPLGDYFVSIAVQDEPKLQQVLAALSAAAGKNESLIVEQTTPSGSSSPLYSLRINDEAGSSVPPQARMLLGSFGLNFTVTQGRLLLCTNTASMKKEMRRLAKGIEEPPKAVVDAFAAAPKQALMVRYADWRPQVRSAWEALSGVAGIAAGQMPPDTLPLELELIPTSQSITKHLGPSTAYLLEAPTGYRLEARSPVGPELLGVVAIAGLWAGLVAEDTRDTVGAFEDDDESDPDMAPSSRASEVDAIALARASLKDLDKAVRTYRAENGSYPKTLSALLLPTDDHPAGYLPKGATTLSDPWGNPYVYRTVNDASSFVLRSSGPNGVDDQGKGDDIVDY